MTERHVRIAGKFDSFIDNEENNVAWCINHATKPLLLQVRRSEQVNVYVCKEKTLYKSDKILETEKRGREKKNE